jgi:8-oxo-dGTP pyrophosphatase MutT (NUDIX family)
MYIVNVEGVVAREGRFLMALRGAGEDHAPGALSLLGGKVERAGNAAGILEATLRREIREEAGIEVEPEMVYLESNAFLTDRREPVVDVVFLCRFRSGTPRITDPVEVAALVWLSREEILQDGRTPTWTRRSIELAAARLMGG